MKVLRGNDILINWSIYLDIGGLKTNVDFSNVKLSVFILDSYGKREAEFNVNENTISIHLGGEIQRLGSVSLDAYWQDNTSLTWSRAKKNNVVELVDNPESISFENIPSDIDIITIGTSSDSFFGGTYVANFDNYYTKNDIDNKIIKDYNLLTNKPLLYNNSTGKYEATKEINAIAGITTGNFKAGISGAMLDGSGNGEVGTLIVRDKIILNGVELGSSSGGEGGNVSTELLWILNCFAYDKDNHAIYLKTVSKPNTNTETYPLGFYSNSFISAKGVGGSGESGEGGLNEELLWSILSNNGTEQIAKNHLTSALSNYATIDSTKIINENLSKLNKEFTNHTLDNDIHLSPDDRKNLNNLLSWFAEDENKDIHTKSYTDTNGNVKYRGFYSSSFISAKGKDNTGSGGSSNFNEELMWAILANTGNEQIAKNHLIGALTDYATINYVNTTKDDINKNITLVSNNLANHVNNQDIHVTISDKEKLNKLFSWFEEDSDGNIYTKDYKTGETIKHRGFYSYSFISAKGAGSGSSDGNFNEELLWAILANNGNEQIAKNHLFDALTGYATQVWVNAQGFLKQNSLDIYATQDWVNSQGFLKSNALTNYATKVWVTDNYVSKIAFTAALDLKLDASIFNDLFEKVNIGTIQSPSYAIRAKYGFYSNSFISAKGAGSNSDTGGLDEELLWAILSNNGIEQISKNHLTDALSGYATETWINAQGFLKQSSLTNYATQSWVNEQGFLKKDSLLPYATILYVDNINNILQANINSLSQRVTDHINNKEVHITTEERNFIKKFASWFEEDENKHIHTKDYSNLDGTTSHRGFYSLSFISAKGIGTDSEAGGLNEELLWSILSNNGVEQIAKNHLTNALNEYATTSWVNEQSYLKQIDLISYATQDWVNEQGFLVNSSLTGYAKETWVEAKDYTTNTKLNNVNTTLTTNINNVADNLATLKTTYTAHAADKIIHITSAERTLWNKVSNYFAEDTVNKAIYVTAERGFYSNSYISAKGTDSSGGSTGGLNEELLWAIMANNGNEQIAKNHLIDALLGYATITWVNSNFATIDKYTNLDNRLITVETDVKNTSDKLNDFLQSEDINGTINKWKELEAFLEGFSDTQTLAELLAIKADKSITISAGTGLTGGGSLAANRSLSLNTASASSIGGVKIGTTLSIAADGVLNQKSGIVTAGTYVKVTVDTYGRVTSGGTLAITDIPNLEISKINGLQNALNLKLNTSVFDDLFEKINIGTSTNPIWAIHAKYGFYSDYFISAKGAGTNIGGGSLDEALLWSILGNNGNEQIAKNHILNALIGYATETWVNGQGFLKAIDLTDYATESWVTTKLASYATTTALTTGLSNKVDKITGKGLSTNDFTSALLTKLNGIEANANNYVLPISSTSILGGVKVGTTFAIDSTGILNLKSGIITIGNYTKISVDTYGRVISGSSLSATDIPNLEISKINGLQNAINGKANINGNNATGTWGINVSGYATFLQSVDTGVFDCNSPAYTMYFDYDSANRDIKNAPTGWQYGGLLTLVRGQTYGNSLHLQLMWDVEHASTTGSGQLWFRTKSSNNGFRTWAKLLDTNNYTSTLDTRYVKKSGDTMTGILIIQDGKGVANGIQTTTNNGLLMYNGGTATYVAQAVGTTYIRSGATDLQHTYNGINYTILDVRNYAVTLDTRYLTISTFNDLFEKVNIGTSAAPKWAIRAKYGFYSDSFITAKGIGDNSGGGGGLDEPLLWAILGNSGNEQINISHIPNLSWGKITSGKPTTLGGYGITDAVKKAGDTMTGTLILSNVTYGASLEVKRVDSGGNAVIKYSNLSGELGYIGICGSAGSFPKDLTFNKSGVGEYKIWHSGNDGSGSGLDADLLDGKHKEEFVAGVKWEGLGTQGTAYTYREFIAEGVNLNFVGFIRRGSWDYANNGYITTNFGNIGLAGTTSITVGASVNTTLFITANTASGTPSAMLGEMLFHIDNGDTYAPTWRRVLTNYNYSSYALPLSGGTLTGVLNVTTSIAPSIIIDTNDVTQSFIRVNQKGLNKSAFGWYSSSYGTFMFNYSSQKYLGITDAGVPHFHGSTLLHAGNYNSYSPTLTGGGASGDWGINITGRSASTNRVLINNTEVKNEGRFQYFQKNADSVMMPDSGWWSLLRSQHGGYTNGYWQEIAQSFAADTVKFRRNVNGILYAWKTFAWLDSNVASATRLETTRVIFGRAFNGTDNVDGQALVYGTKVALGSGYNSGALQIREAGLVGSAQTDDVYAPRIGFHWGSRFGYSIIANGVGFKFQNQAETGYVNLYAGTVYANLSGNSSTATSLQTARTIWGQSFNGTANISGALVGVTSVYSGNILTLNGSSGIYLQYDGDVTKSIVLNGIDFKPFDTSSNKLNLGTNSARWNGIYANTLDLTGNITAANIITTGITTTGRIINTGGINVRIGSTDEWASATIFSAGLYPLCMYYPGGTANTRKYYYSGISNGLQFSSSNDANSYVASIANYYHNGSVTWFGAAQFNSTITCNENITGKKSLILGGSISGVTTIDASSTIYCGGTITMDGAGDSSLIGKNSTVHQGTLRFSTSGNVILSTASAGIIHFRPNGDLNEAGQVYINSSGQLIASTFLGAFIGNASTATKLQTARSINGTSFDGTSDITTANWGTTRSFNIVDAAISYTGASLSVNGAANVTLKMPSTLYAVDNFTANDKRFNECLAYYNSTTQLATGTICITLPNGWNNSMNIYEIYLYEYSNTIGASVITVCGYNYSTNQAWYNYPYHTKGNYNKGVRLAYNGSKCCILLGTTTTTWVYPQVYLKSVFAGYSNQTAWAGGYSISLITSETGYTSIASPARSEERFGKVWSNEFVGSLTGNADSATKLETARTLWGQSFNGTAAISGSLSNVGHIIPASAGAYNLGTSSARFDTAFISDWVYAGTGLYLDGPAVTRVGNLYLELSSAGNEMCVASTTTDLYINYRAPGYASRKAPTTWYWRAGSSNSFADFHVGDLNSNGDVSTVGYYRIGTIPTVSDTWTNVLQSRAGFHVTTEQAVATNSSQLVLGWQNTIASVGYRTTYRIFSCRGTSGFGSMRFGVGNNDGQTSGVFLDLNSSGLARWTGDFRAEGQLISLDNGITSTFGAQNASYCHIYTTAPLFYMDKGLSAASLTSRGQIMAGYMELSSATPFIDFHFGSSTADYTSRLYESASGRLQITGKLAVNGYVNDSYGLATAGLISNTWIRTTGNTGWFSETWSGGIHMTDETWVRVYNGKNFFTAAVGYNGIQTNGGFNRSFYAGNSWNNGHGAYNIEIINNASQTPLMVAYRSGSAPTASDANRLFAMELLNSGTTLRVCFGGAHKFTFENSGNFTAINTITCAQLNSTGGVVAKTTSDRNLKNINYNKVDYTEKLLKLGEVREFTYNNIALNRKEGYADKYQHTGLIYQDACNANITGLCFDKDKDGYGSINYLTSDLMATVIGAVQLNILAIRNHESRLDKLERENRELKNEIVELKNKMNYGK